MDNNDNKNKESESIVDKILDAQKDLNGLILPDMGVGFYNNEVDIDGKEYIKSKHDEDN